MMKNTLLIVLLLTPLIAPCCAETTALESTQAAFIESLSAAQAAAALPVPSGFKPFVSKVVKGSSPAEKITVDVSDCEWLVLQATGVPDNTQGYAVWGEPILTDLNGQRVKPVDLPVEYSEVGFAELVVKKPGPPPHLDGGGRSFKHGIYAHADSVVQFKLDRKYRSFEAWGAVKWPAWKGGTIVFKVDCRPYGVGSCDAWYARCHRDFGGALADWVKTDASDWKEKMRRYTERVLREERLKELDAELESLRAAHQLVHKVPPPEFEDECAKVRSQDVAAIKAFQARVASLRRKVLFSHPGLDFDVLLLNKRQPPSSVSHNVDQYLGRHTQPCPGLVALADWKTDNPKPRLILKDKLPPGSILHPDLSYDASRVLFSFCDHTEPKPQNRRFLIYEAAVDGSWVRQVTGTKNDPLTREGNRYTVLIEDFDPCYLPDGGFVFTSTRGQGFGRCHGGRYAPSFYLYRGELDGSGIRVFSYGEANEIDPAVLNDGRVVYNRWDYINRHDCRFHKLWTARPDGTGVANYYGNLTPKPLSVAEPVVVPGSSKIMATATGHHSYTAGAILLIDVAKGDEGESPLTCLTSEVSYPEIGGMQFPESNYCNPQPISEDLFFAAWSPEPARDIHMRKSNDNAYGIYLVYHVGGKAYRELIYRDPEISCFEPIPIKKRARPPVLATAMDTSLQSPSGTYSIWNIYESTQPIPTGSIKSLRMDVVKRCEQG